MAELGDNMDVGDPLGDQLGDEGAYPEAEVADEPMALSEEDMTPTERANLAASMSEEMQKSIASKCLDRFERDKASRAPRMKHLKEIQEMYALVAKAKDFPFHKAANVKTPALTGPVLQIGARLFDMMWPISGKVFSVVPATAEDTQAAAGTEGYANTYVRYNIPYMSQGLHDTIHQMANYGSSFRRVYWNGYDRKIRADWIPIEDFVVYAKVRSQDPSMSDVPRYTMVHHMSRYDIEAYERDGIYINADKVKGTSTDDDASEFAKAAEKISGQDVDAEDEDYPRQVLEQHCRWKLPKSGKHPAFDGKEHYVVITIDRGSGQMLRMSLREEDDPDDMRRFVREQQAFAKWQDDMRLFVAAQQGLIPPPQAGPPAMGPPGQFDGMPPGLGAPPAAGPPPGGMGAPSGIPGGPMPPGGGAPMMPPSGPAQMGAPPGAGNAPPVIPPMMGGAAPPFGPDMGGMPMAPPPPMTPPPPVPEPRPVRKKQICFFTHYRCFPSDGFYGLGYGDLLYGLAIATNTIINQHIDGVTLRNAKPMFMSRQVRMQRGAVNIQPGEVVEIDGPANQIKDAIFFLDPPMNDPSTVPLVKMLDGMKDIIAGSGDLMSGQVPGSNQTKGGMQILNDQMMTPITVLARTTRESFQHELTKIWRCMGVFLEDDDIMQVMGGGSSSGPPIGKHMFAPTARLVPAADPRTKTARVDDHMQLFEYCMKNPMLAKDPQVGGPVLKKLTEQGFRLFPDGEQLIPLLEPPPPPPPQPEPQWAENAGFLRGQDHPVLPTDNHDEHMQELMIFMQSPDAQLMDKPGRAMAEAHLRGHAAARIEQQRGQMPNGPPGPPPNGQPPGQPPGPFGGGHPPMAGLGNLPPPPPAPGI